MRFFMTLSFKVNEERYDIHESMRLNLHNSCSSIANLEGAFTYWTLYQHVLDKLGLLICRTVCNNLGSVYGFDLALTQCLKDLLVLLFGTEASPRSGRGREPCNNHS